MKKYRLLLNGQNFLMNVDGKPERGGFYANRIVEAESYEQAEKLAVDLIRNDDLLRSCVLNERSDPPMIYVDEIEEFEVTEEVEGPNSGFTFY